MRSRSVLLALLMVCSAGLVATTLAPAAKRPRVITYGATLDVLGWLKVDATVDTTDQCRPGETWQIHQEVNVDTGKKALPVTAQIVNGVASTTTVRKPRGAKHTTAVTGYDATNNCPPFEPEKLAGPPVCKGALTGALDASLAAAPGLFNNEDDDGALVHRVGILLRRIGGGSQSRAGCFEIDGRLKPQSGNTVVGTMAINNGSLLLPLRFTDVKVRKLKLGQTLRDRVHIGGACDKFLVNPPDNGARYAPYTCTVTGSFLVQFKRTVH